MRCPSTRNFRSTLKQQRLSKWLIDSITFPLSSWLCELIYQKFSPIFLTYINKNEFNLCKKRHCRCGFWDICKLDFIDLKDKYRNIFHMFFINKLTVLNYQIKPYLSFDAVIWGTLWYLAVTHLLNYCLL